MDKLIHGNMFEACSPLVSNTSSSFVKKLLINPKIIILKASVDPLVKIISSNLLAFINFLTFSLAPSYS